MIVGELNELIPGHIQGAWFMGRTHEQCDHSTPVDGCKGIKLYPIRIGAYNTARGESWNPELTQDSME